MEAAERIAQYPIQKASELHRQAKQYATTDPSEAISLCQLARNLLNPCRPHFDPRLSHAARQLARDIAWTEYDARMNRKGNR